MMRYEYTEEDWARLTGMPINQAEPVHGGALKPVHSIATNHGLVSVLADIDQLKADLTPVKNLSGPELERWAEQYAADATEHGNNLDAHLRTTPAATTTERVV